MTADSTASAGPCVVPYAALYTVYYDRNCRVCRTEMEHLRALAGAATIELVDCSASTFDDDACRRRRVTRDDLLRALHLHDASGRWLVGVDAFRVLYLAAGLPLIARLWASSWSRPITRRLYPWIARHRYLLSTLGVSRLLDLVYWWKLRHMAPAPCPDGSCQAARDPCRP